MARFPLGTVLFQKYEVKRRLGQGGFAEVYLVSHVLLHVPRALKMVHTYHSNMNATKMRRIEARFRLEARLGARFGYTPFLVQVYDFEQDFQQGLMALVMEYMPGGSLKDRLRQHPSGLPVDAVVALGRQMARALALLHARQIVHRDIKPSNILFDAQGRARLADLGVVQMPESRTRFARGRHPGTPAYMSPEQEQQRGFLPPASDVYSLGVVLFEALTGRNPKTLPPGTRPKDLRDEVPPWLDHLIQQMLAPDPEARPWDGSALVKIFHQEPSPEPQHVHSSFLPATVTDTEKTEKEELINSTPGSRPQNLPPPPPPLPVPHGGQNTPEGQGKGSTTITSSVSPVPPPLPGTSDKASTSLALQTQLTCPVPVLALAAREVQCVVACADFRLKLYLGATLLHTWVQTTGTITSVQWLPSEDRMAFLLGSREGKWALWQAFGSNLATWQVRAEGVVDGEIVAFLIPPEGIWRFMALTHTGVLWAWKRADAPPQRWLLQTRTRVVAAGWTPAGLTVAETRGRVSLWKITSSQWRLAGKWRLPIAVQTAVMAPERVYLGTEDGQVWVFHLSEARVAARWQAHREGLLHMALPTPVHLVTTGWDRQLRLWQAPARLFTGMTLSDLPTALGVTSTHLWVAVGGGQILVYRFPFKFKESL